MKKILIILGIMLTYIMPNGYAQDTKVVKSNNAYVTDYNIALQISKETKQNVVLVFSASWCGFCKTLKKDLPDIKGFDNKIICIVDSDVEKKLTRTFKIRSLPTSILVSPSGDELDRISGYDKSSYEGWLKSNK